MNRERGTILYLVVILVLLTGMFSLGFLGSFHALLRETVRERASLAALYAADGGLAAARAALARDPAWAGGAVDVGRAGRAEISVAPVPGAPDRRLVRVRGAVPSTDAPGALVHRRLAAEVRLRQGLPAIVSYAETE